MVRFLFILSLFSLPIQGAEIHSKHCLEGCPKGGSPSNDLIIRDIYILSTNDRTKFADWAAYQVSAGTIGKSQDRKWKADPYLSNSETLEPKDYTDASKFLGTDRGHMVPLASFSGTPSWPETNFLSNITPQKKSLNQGPWKNLEDAVRKLAARHGSVYVTTGTLYEKSENLLPKADESHMVPSGYWKVVALPDKDSIITASFIMSQNIGRKASFCNSETTITEVEKRSGFKLFHNLSPAFVAIKNQQRTLSSIIGCSKHTVH